MSTEDTVQRLGGLRAAIRAAMSAPTPNHSGEADEMVKPTPQESKP